jgi:hypothetical protein
MLVNCLGKCGLRCCSGRLVAILTSHPNCYPPSFSPKKTTAIRREFTNLHVSASPILIDSTINQHRSKWSREAKGIDLPLPMAGLGMSSFWTNISIRLWRYGETRRRWPLPLTLRISENKRDLWAAISLWLKLLSVFLKPNIYIPSVYAW